MGISTGFGDNGDTRFRDRVVRKGSVYVEVMGGLDILMSYLCFIRGYFRDMLKSSEFVREEVLVSGGEFDVIYKQLGGLCSEVSGYSSGICWDDAVRHLEEVIEGVGFRFSDFIDFAEKSYEARMLNFCRSLCRGIESKLWRLEDEEGGLNLESLRYINRLSDYFWVKAVSFDGL